MNHALLFLAVRLWFKLPPPTLSNWLLLFAGVLVSAGTLPWLWFVLQRVNSARRIQD